MVLVEGENKSRIPADTWPYRQGSRLRQSNHEPQTQLMLGDQEPAKWSLKTSSQVEDSS